MPSKTDQVSSRDDITTDDIKAQFASIGEEISKLSKQFRGLAGGQLRHARSSLGDVYESSKQRVQGAEEGLERYVREQPLRSILIAAGVGALIGVITARR